jgi:hypothetical protein
VPGYRRLMACSNCQPSRFNHASTARSAAAGVKPKLIPPPGYILLPGPPEPQRGNRIRI